MVEGSKAIKDNLKKKKEIKKEIVAKIKCLGKERKNWDLKFFKQNKIFSVLIR